MEKDPNTINETFWNACWKGDLQIIQRFIDTVPRMISARNVSFDTPLLIAAMHGYTPIVQFLLDHGADPNASNSTGDTVLMYAAPFTDVTKLLLEAGADISIRQPIINPVDIKNMNWKARWQILKKLHRLHRGFSTQLYRGDSPLMRAADRGSLEAITLLVEAGADINERDNWGDTALLRVVILVTDPFNPMHNSESLIETIKVLLSLGADPNVVEPLYGDTPLTRASRVRATEIVEILLDGRANPNLRQGTSGETPISLLLRDFNNPPSVELVERMITAGADINALSKGIPPLIYAINSGQLGIIQLLLKHEADPNLSTEDGVTPLLAATQANVNDTIRARILHLLKNASMLRLRASE